MSARDEYIKGLRDLAGWLEANPAAPLRKHDGATVQHSIDLAIPDRDDAMRELGRLAGLLGLDCGPLYGDDPRHYGFSVEFGPVRYTAISIKERRFRR